MAARQESGSTSRPGSTVNPERFRIIEPSAPDEAWFPEGRVTVDTEEDYRAVVRLFEDLHRSGPIEIDRLVPWLKAHRENVPLTARDAEARNG